MKKLVKIVLALVVLLAVVVIAGVLTINHWARRGIENGATQALGVTTTLRGIQVGLLASEADLDSFSVTNPTGFDGDFLTFKDGGVKLTVGSLMEDTVEVPYLHLTEVTLNLLKAADGKANYQAILDNLKGEEAQPDAVKKEGKKFVIREVVFKDVTVTARIAVPSALGAVAGLAGKSISGGEIKPVTLKIPEIRLTDVGSGGDNPKAIRELTDIFIKAILQKAMQDGAGILPAELTAELGAKLAQLKSLEAMGVNMTGTLDKIGKDGLDLEKQKANIENLTKDAGKTVDEVKKGVGGLGDLLGGKKDE